MGFSICIYLLLLKLQCTVIRMFGPVPQKVKRRTVYKEGKLHILERSARVLIHFYRKSRDLEFQKWFFLFTNLSMFPQTFTMKPDDFFLEEPVKILLCWWKQKSIVLFSFCLLCIYNKKMHSVQFIHIRKCCLKSAKLVTEHILVP